MADDKTTAGHPAPHLSKAQREAMRLTHLFMREYGITNGDRMYRDILAAIHAGERRGSK